MICLCGMYFCVLLSSYSFYIYFTLFAFVVIIRIVLSPIPLGARAALREPPVIFDTLGTRLPAQYITRNIVSSRGCRSSDIIRFPELIRRYTDVLRILFHTVINDSSRGELFFSFNSLCIVRRAPLCNFWPSIWAHYYDTWQHPGPDQLSPPHCPHMGRQVAASW